MRNTATVLRRFLVSLSFVGLLVATMSAHAQVTTLSGYTYSVSTGNSLTDMSSATQRVSSGVDDAAYGTWDIGFDFTFCGTTYRYFSVSTNGPLGLHTYSSGMVGSNIGASLQYPPFSPYITGGNADLYTRGNGIRSQVFGSAPNRYLVVEYDIYRYGNSGTTALWQIRLYERSGAFEILYGSSTTGWGNLRMGATNGGTDIASLNTSDNSVSYYSESTSNSPASEGTLYRFAPCVPNISLIGDVLQGGTSKMNDNDSLLYGVEIERGSTGSYWPFTVELGFNPCSERSWRIEVTGPAAADYTVFPSSGTLGGSSSVTPTVTFDPQATGLRNATLVVTDDAGLRLTYRLQGVGLPRISWTGNTAQGGTSAMADKDTIMQSVGADRGTTGTFRPFSLLNFSRNSEAPAASIVFELIDPTGQYAISPTSTWLGAGEGIEPVITFNATGLGPQYATLRVTADGDVRTFVLAASSRAPQLRFTAGEELTSDQMLMYRITSCAGSEVVSVPVLFTNYGQAAATISSAAIYSVDANSTLPIQQRPLVRDAQGRLVADPQFQFSLVPGVAPLNRATDLVFPLTIPAGGSRTVYVNFVGGLAGRPLAKAFIWTNAQNLLNADPSGKVTEGLMSFMIGPRVLGSKLAGNVAGTPLKPVVFPAVKLGNTARQSVMIANAGECELRISKTELILNAGDTREFELVKALPNTRVDAATGDFVLAPGAADSLVFTFHPDGRGTRRVTVRLKTNDSSIYLYGLSERGTQYLDVFGEGATDLATKDLSLGQVLVGDVVTATTTIENPNVFPLTISAIEFVGADAAEFTEDPAQPWPATPYAIKQTERLPLSIRWSPVGAPGRRDAMLVVRSASGVIGTVRIHAEAGTRELTATPSSLFDGMSVPVGQVIRRMVAVTNTGSFDVRLGTPELTGVDAGNYRIGRIPRTVLAPGATEYLEVTFSPTGQGQSSATLEIPSNAGNSPAIVTLGGESMEARRDEDQGANRVIDPNGDGSKVLTVQSAEATIGLGVTVQPNPASTSIEVLVTVRRATVLGATLVDGRGAAVRSIGTVSCEAGTNRVTIDVRELPAGTYAVRFDGEQIVKAVRFAVAR